jgi:hypothetical protein
MEYCPYCQRWVEPTKGNTDILAGAALGGWFGGVVGTGHYLLKGSRCPICNNLIRSRGPAHMFPQQARVYSQYPQPVYQQYPQPLLPYVATSQFPVMPQIQYPRVTRAIPVPPSPCCSYCGQTLAYEPNLRQWYCQYCQRPVQT